MELSLVNEPVTLSVSFLSVSSLAVVHRWSRLTIEVVGHLGQGEIFKTVLVLVEVGGGQFEFGKRSIEQSSFPHTGRSG